MEIKNYRIRTDVIVYTKSMSYLKCHFMGVFKSNVWALPLVQYLLITQLMKSIYGVFNKIINFKKCICCCTILISTISSMLNYVNALALISFLEIYYLTWFMEIRITKCVACIMLNYCNSKSILPGYLQCFALNLLILYFTSHISFCNASSCPQISSVGRQREVSIKIVEIAQPNYLHLSCSVIIIFILELAIFTLTPQIE